MTNRQAIGVIKFEIACVNRQDTPQCTRDCKKCDLCLPTEDVLQAYEMAIKALEQEPNCLFYEIDDDGHGLCKNHRYMDECEDAVQRTSNADKKHVENTLEDAVTRAVQGR